MQAQCSGVKFSQQMVTALRSGEANRCHCAKSVYFTSAGPDNVRKPNKKINLGHLSAAAAPEHPRQTPPAPYPESRKCAPPRGIAADPLCTSPGEPRPFGPAMAGSLCNAGATPPTSRELGAAQPSKMGNGYSRCPRDYQWKEMFLGTDPLTGPLRICSG